MQALFKMYLAYYALFGSGANPTFDMPDNDIAAVEEGAALALAAHHARIKLPPMTFTDFQIAWDKVRISHEGATTYLFTRASRSSATAS